MNYPNPAETPHGPGPHGSPLRPPGSRPGRAGIWIGIGLLVAAIVVPIILAVTLVIPAFQLDQRTFQADGKPQTLVLPANADYAVYVVDNEFYTYLDARCEVADSEGVAIPLERPSGKATVNGWKVQSRFATGSGTVVATCISPGGDGSVQDVRIGRSPDMAAMLGGIFGAIAAAGLLGLAGLVCIIVTVVRRSRR